MTKQAKIVVELVGYDCRMTKYFTGTDDEIYLEANDYMSDLIMRYFKDNNVQDPNEQEKIINSATHFIVFEKEIPTMMYAIVEADDSEPQVLGVYATRAEAEEIANSMINVLKNWQTVAKRYGLPQAEINRMAPAFKV